MAALTGNKIKDSYLGLLKSISNDAISSSFVQISDGGGNALPLYLSTASIRFYDAYTFPSATGTVGQVLSADASGNLVFSDQLDNQTLEQVLTNGNTTTTAILSTASGNTFGSTTFNGIATLANTSKVLGTPPTANDSSTNIATTAYVDNQVSTGGTVKKTGTISQNAIAVWNNASDTLRSDGTISVLTDGTIRLNQEDTTGAAQKNYNIGGGNIALNTGNFNTGFGKDNLNKVAFTTGGFNNAFGYNTLFSMTTGVDNSAFGANALYSETVGDGNIAIGGYSMYNSENVYFSVAIGTKALYSNTTGTQNIALGFESLYTNVSGDANTSLGYRALKANLGDRNIAVGYGSGISMTTGDNNVIIGSFSGQIGTFDIRATDNNIILSDGSGAVKMHTNSSGGTTFNVSSFGLSIEESTNNAPRLYFKSVGVTKGQISYNVDISPAADEFLNISGGSGYILLDNRLQFNSYGSGTHTGTLAKTLGVDTNGNVIEFTSGTGSVGGTGTAGTIAKWATGGANIEDSIITESASAITVSGDVKVNEVNPLIFADSTSTNKASGVITSESGTNKWAIGTNFGSSDNSFNIYNYTAASRYLTISSTGLATFSGNILAEGGEIFSKISSGLTAAVVKIGSGSTWQLKSNPTTGTNSYGFEIVQGVGSPQTRLSITSAGNVGIGAVSTETTPSTLHIKGSEQQLTISEGTLRGATFDYKSSTGNLQIATNGVDARLLPQITLAPSGFVTFSGTTSANVVIVRDNMFVGAGQFYIGAENSSTDDTYRQEVGSGVFKIQSRKSGTWTDRLTISSGGNATFSNSADASVQIGNPGGGDLNAYLKLKASGSGDAYVNSIGTGKLILGAGSTGTNHLSISSNGYITQDISLAGRAMEIVNTADASEGLRIKAADNDPDLDILDCQSSTGGTYTSKFKVRKSGELISTKGIEFQGNSLGASQTGVASSGSGGDLRFYTDGTQRVTIKSGGAISLENANTSVIGRPFSSGTLANGANILLNINGAGGDQSLGFIAVSCTPSTAFQGGAVALYSHYHTQGANGFTDMQLHNEKGITISRSNGDLTITNNHVDGYAAKYVVKVLNLTDFASTVAGT